MQPLISVVIPCYNQSNFLADALESVLVQENASTEIIIVDDGSIDAPEAVVERYPGNLYVRQHNQGLSAARNAGFRRSNGELVLFLDADDRLLPAALTEAANFLATRPDCAFVYGHVQLISEDGTRSPTPPQSCVAANHYLELLKGNFIWTSGSVLYRRTALMSVGLFDPSARAAGDLDLNFRIARVSNIGCLDRVLLEYRQHSGNMTRDLALMLASEVTVRRRQRRFVKGNRLYTAALKFGLRSVRADYGDRLAAQMFDEAQRGQLARSLTNAATLLRYHPTGLWRSSGAVDDPIL